MEFTQTGSFRVNYLEELTTLKPTEKIQEMLLKKLDYLIGFLAKEKLEIIADFIKNLTSKFQGLVDEDFLTVPFATNEKIYEEIFSKFKNLAQYPDLNKASLYYYFHLLQLNDQNAREMTEVKITMKVLLDAWLNPSYYSLQTLAETIGRKEAVRLYKQYITHFHIDHPSPHRDKFVNLEKKLEDRLSGDTTSSEWVIVHTMLEDGKYAFKNENCPTCVDAMVDLTDVEFKYLVACYGDYEAFRANHNDHIILTMEHTIMQGDPYCSRVLHDTRIDYDLRHPPNEFWENFTPGKEEEAKKYYKK
ncbi:MAG: hypothetical protein ACXAD7_04430 [Candidatus Kariarchaeaceae archaeon]|jgi:hypothetical protein